MQKIIQLVHGSVFTLLFLIFLSGCNQSEVTQLENENEELREINEQKDSTINDLVSSFNRIQDNLATIKERQAIIDVNASNDVEVEGRREAINRDIQLINKLMQENEEAINDLNRKLRSSNIKIAEFEKLLQRTNQQINEKNMEISALKDELAGLNFAIDQLNATVDTLLYENQEKEEIISTQDEKLNTAWFAFGTAKELEEAGVITKEGGFIGIGKVEKLVADFNNDYFTKIDIRNVKSVPLYVDKAEVITTHPSDSYELIEKDKKVESLSISKPGEFWKSSKYLVIVVN